MRPQDGSSQGGDVFVKGVISSALGPDGLGDRFWYKKRLSGQTPERLN